MYVNYRSPSTSKIQSTYKVAYGTFGYETEDSNTDLRNESFTVAYSNVFNFDNGTLLYENFNILEWTYSSYNSDPIEFGTYTNNCPGCTDASAVNFNQYASFDDNSCEYAGCTNPVSYTHLRAHETREERGCRRVL